MTETNVVLTIPEPRKVVLKDKPYSTLAPGYSMIEIAPVCIEHQPGYRLASGSSWIISWHDCRFDGVAD